MKSTHILIERIKESNLSEDDKKVLIEALEGDKPDYLKFLNYLYKILQISKECLELFDIDDFF